MVTAQRHRYITAAGRTHFSSSSHPTTLVLYRVTKAPLLTTHSFSPQLAQHPPRPAPQHLSMRSSTTMLALLVVVFATLASALPLPSPSPTFSPTPVTTTLSPTSQPTPIAVDPEQRDESATLNGWGGGGQSFYSFSSSLLDAPICQLGRRPLTPSKRLVSIQPYALGLVPMSCPLV